MILNSLGWRAGGFHRRSSGVPSGYAKDSHPEQGLYQDIRSVEFQTAAKTCAPGSLPGRRQCCRGDPASRHVHPVFSSSQILIPSSPCLLLLIRSLAATFFTVYESTKSLLRTACPSSTPQPVIHSIASATAELSSCLILTPAEVIKQNAQMIRRQPEAGSAAASTSLRAFRMLQASEGGVLRRLWSGYTALAARNLPVTAMQFPAFEAIRSRVWTWRDRRATRKEIGGVVSGQGIVETGVVNGLSAAASGAFAAALTTPTDVVKTRMMLSTSEEGQGKETRTAERRKSTRLSGFQVAKLVYHERGIRGLFRGGVFRMAWTAVGSGLYLGTYEAAKVWL